MSKSPTASSTRRPARLSGRHSAETSPLRAYISPLKDFSAYTPVRQAREKSVTMRTRLNTSVEERKKPTSQTSALESMNDLRNKTSKLDEETRKLAEKVGQVRLKLQGRRGKTHPGVKSLPRAIVSVLGKVQREGKAKGFESIRRKAKERLDMERKAAQSFELRRLNRHFAAWRARLGTEQNEEMHLMEIAKRHYKRRMSRLVLRTWKNSRRTRTSTYFRRDVIENPRPASLSPKPIQPDARPLSSSNTRKSPVTSVKSKIAFPRTAKAFSKENAFSEPINPQLLSLAVKHHNLSLLVLTMQYYRIWKPLQENVAAELALAKQHYRKHLGQIVFHAWLEFYVTSYADVSSAHSSTESHYDSIIYSFRLVPSRQHLTAPPILTAWKAFVALSKSEKQQEERRNQLWQKVNGWLEQYKSGAMQL